MSTGSRAVWYLMVAVAAIVLLACDQPRGNILGRVFDENGEPVANMPIMAESVSHGGVILKSDKDGAYRLSNMLCGLWDVKFYNSAGVMIGIEAAKVILGETCTVDFKIGAKPPPCYSEVISNPP